MMWTVTLLLSAVFTTFGQVTGSGVFEVLLTSLSNDRGMTSRGECCHADRESRCSGQCRTFVTVCLMHYQNKVVRSYPSCTFGQFVTPLLGGNNVDLREETGDGPYTIRLPFTFSWPESFTLIIEVWHDGRGNRSVAEETLILGVQRTDSVRPSQAWRRQQEGNRHAELTFSYRVLCDPHYYGASCDRLCRPRDDRFGHYACSGNGTKLCAKGWSGQFCDHALCHERCSPARGFCDSPTECRCRMGWRGEFCEDCMRSPDCRHGDCHQPWQCICQHGWAGINCDIDTSYCEKHQPCPIGATCRASWVQNYTCECPPGFGGDHCEREVCLPDTCHHGGICQESGTSASCLCPAGFTGRRCEQVTCEGVACHNNGTCVLEAAGPQCLCASGFSGPDCRQDARPCASNPCQNGGTCSDGSGGFQCRCTAGHEGIMCESQADPCATKHCRNGGTCSLEGREAKCQCPRGFRGHFCQHKVALCSPSVCANGGSCQQRGAHWHCSCRRGFKGKNCRIATVHCKRHPGERCDCPVGTNKHGCSHRHNATEPVLARIEHPPASAVISAALNIKSCILTVTIVSLLAVCPGVGRMR